MQVYSNSINNFLSICKKQAKKILESEMKLSYSRSRLKWKNFTVPLNFVVFEHETNLGFFNHRLYQVGLNKRLLLVNDPELILNTLRHELAHLVTFLQYGDSIDDHGREYREVCKSYGWDQNVFNAKVILKEGLPAFEKQEQKHEKLKGKIIKLLNLANSDNENESHSAAAKANELLIKFNLTQSDLNDDEEETYLCRVLEGARVSAKAKAIYEILTTFNVQPVFNHSKGYFYLEVIGAKENVELADYISSYLERELEQLWNLARKNNPRLKGASSKNSYFRGLAEGYKEKITHTQKSSFTSKELMTLKHDLESRVNTVYSRLGHSSSSRVKNDHYSSTIGRKTGKNLNIKSAISNLNPIKLLR
jgi:hypothetical protein